MFPGATGEFVKETVVMLEGELQFYLRNKSIGTLQRCDCE